MSFGHLCADTCVEQKHLVIDDSDGAEVGTFTVLPEGKRVHYQRRHSAFYRQAADGNFDWPAILDTSARPVFMHATGITPLCGPGALANWRAALRTAGKQGVGVLLDLNHRPALGTLEELWGHVSPFLSGTVHVLVLSRGQLVGVANLLSVDVAGVEDAVEDDPAWVDLMCKVHAAINGPVLACCFKVRDARGIQRRWSVIVDASGTHSTFDRPVYHRPKDECGGGSAWAAGVMDALSRRGVALDRSGSGPVKVVGLDLNRVARRADLLAALCQESFGDHSVVPASALNSAEKEFDGLPARIGHDVGGPDAEITPVLAGVGSADTFGPDLQGTVDALGRAKVLAILRAKNFDVALARGVELAELGCRAIEVTLDSVEFVKLVSALVERIGDRVVVGAGTVMNHEEITKAARAGCRFALSPVKPLHGFVHSCHASGMVAVPAAYTPQEIYECAMEGARCIKLFPAQLWKPSTLKDLRAVGMFGTLNIMPSGGVNPVNAFDWFAHGAFAVGMGSKLVGGDVRVKPEDAEALAVRCNAQTACLPCC